MAIVLEPGIATESSKHYVEIETQSSLTRGMTVVDKLHQAQRTANRDIWAQAITAGQNVSVTWAIDNQRWKNLLYSLLR
jgi:inosine-uridine nucleoside N-ribohydrolase